MLGKLKEDQCGWNTMWRVVQDVFGVPRWHSGEESGLSMPSYKLCGAAKKKREVGGSNYAQALYWRGGRQRMRWLDSINRLDGLEFEQTPGESGGEGSLECCSPWGCKELDMT